MIQEGSYKGASEAVLAYGIIHLVMALGVLFPSFAAEQAYYQMTSIAVMIIYISVGFYYYRFKREQESMDYLTWRMTAMGLITLSGLQYCYHAFYQSAGKSSLFYWSVIIVVGSYVVALLLRLKNNAINLEAALSDGRFRQDGTMDFAVCYRPVTLPIPYYKKLHINNHGLQTQQPKNWFYGLIGVSIAVLSPLLMTDAGAYIVGGLMVMMSYYYAMMCLHCTLDWVFYKQLQARLIKSRGAD